MAQCNNDFTNTFVPLSFVRIIPAILEITCRNLISLPQRVHISNFVIIKQSWIIHIKQFKMLPILLRFKVK
jgi:hypothetical protein